jgi:hypothetical protein
MIEATIKIVVLKDRASWADWFDALRGTARNEGIWEEINPFNDYAIDIDNSPPDPLAIVDELILRETEDRYIRYQIAVEIWNEDTRSVEEKGQKPVSLTPVTFVDIREYYSVSLRDYEVKKTN